MDDDVIRFLVSTDNHLGFAERDPVRGNDSLAAFEEVLRTAIAKKVDFILFAGDMFHENKPTRKTLHSTMELLRRYCLGPEAVFIEILNDQSEIFKAGLGHVNYEDPFQSIRLPIFSIHGNHDDPSREGGSGDALAAMDLLAVSNLINYYGKADKVEDIEITPILIRKANTKIALYGLGAMRDERLNRMWNQKKVKFVRLTEAQGRDEYYNIFVLHQNRDYGRGKKNCVHESMIPEWMDLVIWGNEHECQPNLAESLVGTYRILQPGSSVACSFSASESSACPKHMAFFEVKQRKFRMKPIRYQQVRVFHYDEMVLRNVPGLDPNHPKIEDKIKEALGRKIRDMIREARSEIPLATEADGSFEFGPKFKIADPEKVLIRLKVDYEGFQAINHQRFGSQFVADVANPTEILLLSKKRKEMLRVAGQPGNGGGDHTAQGELRMLIAEGAEEEIHKIKIEDLVNETLANGKSQLSILSEAEMAKALDDYIVKKLPNAIQDLVVESLERAQRELTKNQTADDRNVIMRAVGAAKSDGISGVSRSSAITPALNDEEEESVGGIDIKRIKRGGAKHVPSKASSSNRTAVDLIDLDDDDIPKTSKRGTVSTKAAVRGRKTASRAEESEDGDEAKPRRGSKRSAAIKAKSYVDEMDEEEEEEEADFQDIEDDESEDEDESESDEESEDYSARKKGKGTSSKAPARGSNAKAAPAAKKTAARKVATSGRGKKQPPPEDVIEDSDDDVVEIIDDNRPAPVAAAGGTKRTLPSMFSQQAPVKATKGRGKASAADDWD